MKNSIILLPLALLIWVACEKSNEPSVEVSDNLIGGWMDPVIEDTLVTYKRTGSLPENSYGFVFKPDQKFIERKIAGWCATPPVSFANYNGSWNLTGSDIHISVAYWGGIVDYQWKIVSVDKDQLTLYKVAEHYHDEQDRAENQNQQLIRSFRVNMGARF